MSVKAIHSIPQYQGRIFSVEKVTLQHEDGTKFVRDLVKKNECVVCMVYHKTLKRVLLTKEFRTGMMSHEYGFIAGIIDEGERPYEAAIREIQEEAGFTLEGIGIDIIKVGETFSSSGFTNEKVHHFYAVVDGKPKEQQLDEDERIQIHPINLVDLDKMMADNDILSSHAQVCYFRTLLIANQLSALGN